MELPKKPVVAPTNPELVTSFIHSIGASGSWAVSDVTDLSDQKTGSLPRPVEAFVLRLPAGMPREDSKGDLVAWEEQRLLFFGAETPLSSGMAAVLIAVANSDVEVEKGSVINTVS
jgi:hypothetical protein